MKHNHIKALQKEYYFKVYLEVKAGGRIYRSGTLTGTTAQEFDNGWQRLSVTFTLGSAQSIEVRTAVECTAAIISQASQERTNPSPSRQI